MRFYRIYLRQVVLDDWKENDVIFFSCMVLEQGAETQPVITER